MFYDKSQQEMVNSARNHFTEPNIKPTTEKKPEMTLRN